MLIVLYVCLFSGLGAIGLVGPDEPRYAAIARAMAETHDWITPRLWGTPWFEKPVLYYWAAGIAMRIFGVSEFAARLPSALAGLLAVIAVKWTALRSYGIGTAWYSLLMLSTSVAMVGFSRAAGPDMLFAGLLTAAMAIAVEMLRTQRPGAFLRIAFGFFLGAAVLAKGPAAVILAGGATLLWAAMSRNWLAPFRFLHPLAIAAFCVTALPWYVVCAMRNPDFLHVFIWQHNFERYATPIFEHRQPIWFYAYILLLAVLPWILFLIGGPSDRALRKKYFTELQSVDIFFSCWVGFPILFFSFSQSKLPSYALPAIPPLFVLLGRWVSTWGQGQTKPGLGGLGWIGALLVVLADGWLACFGLLFVPWHIGIPAWVLTFVLGIVMVGVAARKRPVSACLTTALVIAVSVEIANFQILPYVDAEFSTRRLAGQLQELSTAGTGAVYHDIPRNVRYGIEYYLNREMPEWRPGLPEPVWILGSADPGAARIPMNSKFTDNVLYEVGHALDLQVRR